MRLAAVVILTAATLVVPASALAAPVIAAPLPVASAAQTPYQATPPQTLNLASAKTALNAYSTYLQALVKLAPAAQATATTYVSTVAAECKSALTPLTTPSYQVDATVQSNLTAIGQELGDDLSITYDDSALAPFAKLSITLARLRWTKSSGGAAIVRRYLDDQSAALIMAPSSLCEDALLVAATPQTALPSTKLFVKQYTKASTAAGTSLTDFLNLLHTYETSSERTLVTKIATLATQVTKLSKTAILASAKTLTTALETT